MPRRPLKGSGERKHRYIKRGKKLASAIKERNQKASEAFWAKVEDNKAQELVNSPEVVLDSPPPPEGQSPTKPSPAPEPISRPPFGVKRNKISLDYTPTPAQRRFSNAIANGARVALFLGGIRAGKTYAGSYEVLKQIYRYYKMPNLGWIVSPTYPMSKVPENMFRAHAQDLIVKHLKGDRAFLMMPSAVAPNNYYRVEVKSAEHPDRLRGPSLGWIWIDEGAMISKECWRVLLGRVLDSRGIIIITTTPAGRNWLYEEVYLQSLKNPLYACIEAPTIENPYLDGEEIKSLRERYSSEFAQQELDAKFMSFEGLVFKDYSTSLHYCKPKDIPESAHIICGVDFGYNDPFVCLWLGKWDGVWHVLDEHYQAHKTLDYHLRIIQAHPLAKRVVRIWGDPSAAQARADMIGCGIKVLPAIKTVDKGCKGWVNSRIQEITRRLTRTRMNGEPGLEVWTTAPNTNAEFMAYRYRDPKDRNAGEAPVDAANHCIDALGYGIYSESKITGDMNPRYQDDAGVVQVLTPREQIVAQLKSHFERIDSSPKATKRSVEQMFPTWYTD